MEIKQTADLIRLSQNIGILGHQSGDADCYGAMFALANSLSLIGKKATVFSGESFPVSLDYLFYYFHDEIKSVVGPEIDLLIILDTSDQSRINGREIYDYYVSKGAKVVVIDHHNPGDLYHNSDYYSYTKTKVSSTCELIFDLIKELNIAVDKKIATLLLSGIVFDTSSFNNQNTYTSTFEASSELMAHGARLKVINKNLFGSKEVDVLKLWGLAMNRLHHNKEWGVVSSFLTYKDIEECGISADALSGIINFLNSVKGAKLVLLITEEEKGKLKVSLRTRDDRVNVSKLAIAFGGGGHNKAAAFKLTGSLETNNDLIFVRS